MEQDILCTLFGLHLPRCDGVFLHLSSYHHWSLSSPASQFIKIYLSYILVEILGGARY